MAVLGLLAAGALWFLARNPVGLVIGGGAVALVGLATVLLNLRLARETRRRAGEDIGTFARAFDRRSPSFDPWVVRAVWDALAPWTVVWGDARLPLRPTDRIAELGCVGTDLDEACHEAATRARRTLEDTSGNPYAGRIETVGDLVAFICRQPRTATGLGR